MKNPVLYILLLVFSFCSCSESGPDIIEPDDKVPVNYTPIQDRSFKRGVSYNFQMVSDTELLGNGVSWFYNWAPDINNELDVAARKWNLDFYPMAWNGGNYEPGIRNYKHNHPLCEYILAFNEPNLVDQAKMTPAEAAAEWPRLKALATELNMKLISPAMNYGTLAGYSDPIKWLDEFFTLIPLSDIEGIAVHCYMGNASSLKSYVHRFKKYGKPIWMTEFCAWENFISNESMQMKFMSDAVNYLESDPDIYRYAWFIPRYTKSDKPFMQLITNTRPYALTNVGKVYMNMSTFDKSAYYKDGQVIPAEHYSAMNMSDKLSSESWAASFQLRPTTDESGILELYGFSDNYWAEYQLTIPETRKYSFDFRYSSYSEGTLILSVGDVDVATIELPGMSDFEKWNTVTALVDLPQGKHTLRVTSVGNPICLNWLCLRK